MASQILEQRQLVASETDVETLQASFGLTRREADICVSLSKGLSTARLCNLMGIGRETLKTHLKRSFEKMDVHSQVQLVALVIRLLAE